MSANRRTNSGYYCASIETFLNDDHERVLGTLAAAHPFSLDTEQKQAWEIEIRILTAALQNVPGEVYFEFDVPRLASRIDVVVVSGAAVFPIEFKCGETRYHTADYNQAWDYGRLQSDRWSYHAFRGDAWTTIRDENRKRYLLNAYRVLLTRARQGMVIFVPEGDDADPTRARSYYDHTFSYLSELGMQPV